MWTTWFTYTLDLDLLNLRSVVHSSSYAPVLTRTLLMVFISLQPLQHSFLQPHNYIILMILFYWLQSSFPIQLGRLSICCRSLNMDLCSSLMTTSSALSCLRVLVNEHLSTWFLTCVSLDLTWPCLDTLLACLLGLDFLKIALNRLDVPYQ